MQKLRNQSVQIQQLIFNVFAIIKKQADSIFRKHNLTGAQVGVLSRLSETEGKPMNKISSELWCDVSNITGVVDRLEKQNFVWRTAHPEDRRINLIGLTRQGRTALSETLPEHETALIERINILSAEERQALINILTKLVK